VGGLQSRFTVIDIENVLCMNCPWYIDEGTIKMVYKSLTEN